MAEFRNRRDNPSPDVLSQEIYLPDDQDYGTGVFRFVTKQNALFPAANAEPRAIGAIAMNVPRFQISVTINPGTKEIAVLLGRADGTEPSAVQIFLLPSDMDAALAHEVEAGFQNWQVVCLRLDGSNLPRKPASSTALPSVAGVLQAKEGVPMSIPPLGPQCPRTFTVDEQKRVTTVLDFELPFALEELEGRLPVTVVLGKIEGDVGIRTRHRHPDEIARSLGLAFLAPPSSGVIVAAGDPHGRINVSSIQFQFRGFVDLAYRREVFQECLDSTNRIVERYRMAKRDFRVRKIAKSDVLSYGARHRFDGQTYNDWYEPVAPVRLVQAPNFPCDLFLRNALWFRYAARSELWEHVLSEARHYLAVGDRRLAIVTAFMALELVLMQSNGRNLKAFFHRFGLPVAPLPIPGTRKSVNDCLTALKVHASDLSMEVAVTERMLDHYNRRNLIVHHGMMRITEDHARECIEDTYLLIRHILDMLHLSIVAQLELLSVPQMNAAFSLLRLEAPEWRVVFSFGGGSVNALLAKRDSGPETTLHIPWADLKWNPGQKGAILLSYDARFGQARLAFNGPDVVAEAKCSIGYVDASLLGLATFEMPEAIMRPGFPAQFLVHSRVVQPEELAHLNSLVVPVGDEEADATDEDC